MANSVVNGIASQVEPAAEVIRLDLLSAVGRQAARAFGVSLVPASLVFDPAGRLIYRHIGLPEEAQIVTLLQQAAAGSH